MQRLCELPTDQGAPSRRARSFERDALETQEPVMMKKQAQLGAPPVQQMVSRYPPLAPEPSLNTAPALLYSVLRALREVWTPTRVEDCEPGSRQIFEVSQAVLVAFWVTLQQQPESAGRGGPDTSRPTASRDIPPTGSSSSRNPTTKRARPRGSGGDEGDEGNGRGGGRQSKKIRDEKLPQTMGYACPFFKYDMITHWRCHDKYRNTSDVRQHLHRKPHKPPVHCPTCHVRFQDESQAEARRESHIREQSCSPTPHPAVWVTPDQLRAIKRSGKVQQSARQAWNALWAILFPDKRVPEDPFTSGLIPVPLLDEIIRRYLAEMHEYRMPASLSPREEQIWMMAQNSIFSGMREIAQMDGASTVPPQSPPAMHDRAALSPLSVTATHPLTPTGAQYSLAPQYSPPRTFGGPRDVTSPMAPPDSTQARSLAGTGTRVAFSPSLSTEFATANPNPSFPLIQQQTRAWQDTPTPQFAQQSAPLFLGSPDPSLSNQLAMPPRWPAPNNSNWALGPPSVPGILGGQFIADNMLERLGYDPPHQYPWPPYPGPFDERDHD